MTIPRITDDMEVRHVVAAGLDLHKMLVTATVRPAFAENRRPPHLALFAMPAEGEEFRQGEYRSFTAQTFLPGRVITNAAS